MRQIFELIKLVFSTLLIVLIGGSLAYFGSDKFKILVDSRLQDFFGCTTPLTYSIAEFDDRFGISKQKFIENTKTAEKIWEDAGKKDLFEYKESGGLILVNLIYDDRQESTEKLRDLGYIITNDRASYDKLKLQYDELRGEILSERTAINKETEAIQRDKKEYEKKVEYWNNRGGAPQKEYKELEAEQESLNKRIASLNKKQSELNQDIETVNSMGTVLNNLIVNLNLDVEKFNNTQGTIDREFDQGEYEESGSKRSINIYQFDNENKLTRVLAHEFGHALGMEHNDNSKSIMYSINKDESLIPTKEDLEELTKVCKLR